MTVITANEYRTAAKVCDAEEDWSRAKALRELADLIDANDARDAEREARHLASKLAHDAEITALAIIQMEGESGWWRGVECDRFAERTYESMTGDNQQAIRSGVSAVLAHLTSTNRLIPAGGITSTPEWIEMRDNAAGWQRRALKAEAALAGGMALTAEQVEDVRALVWLDGRSNFEAFYRLRSLIPATEPKPIGWYRTMEREFATEHFGFPDVTGLLECTHTASDGGTWGWGGDGDWELLVYPPAPAEPAGEETKAERRDPDELAKRMALIWEGGWDEFDEKERDYLRCAAEIARAYYASSPVVPTPTETGPWQRIEDVPKNVMVRGTDGTWRGDPDGWLRSPGARASANQCAPFVAAEEGSA